MKELPKVYLARAGANGEDEEYALDNSCSIIGFREYPSLEGAKESGASAITRARRYHVKVVVVGMFEIVEDTGDVPGEYQLWVEREHLDQFFSLLSGHHVRMNKDGVLDMLTGVATAKAAKRETSIGRNNLIPFGRIMDKLRQPHRINYPIPVLEARNRPHVVIIP
jgi:hypothetical protein